MEQPTSPIFRKGLEMSADTRSKANKGYGDENAGAPVSLDEAGGKSSLQRGLELLRDWYVSSGKNPEELLADEQTVNWKA